MPLLILLIAGCVATWYCIQDAHKRGMHATGWGTFVLLTTGAGLPIYLLARRRKAV